MKSFSLCSGRASLLRWRFDRTGGAFVGRFQQSLGESRAKAVFRAARQQAAVAQTLFAQFSPALHRAMPQAVAPASILWTHLLPAVPTIPDWRSLFGDVDFCACKHCGSIHGPAAYAVDLLAFVRNQSALGTLAANGRRGDLVELELTCQNTDTPLPYIDLINEILGRAVASPGAATPQTNVTAEELRAQPEHHNEAAESALSDAVYPWSLPFSRPVEEARAYLAHLGTPRHHLMEIFRPEGDGASPSELEVAVENLGLTPIERQILVDEPLNPPRTLSEFWGLAGLSLGQLRNRLVRPRDFVQQAGLAYGDVVALFATRFVSPGADVEIDFDDGGCNLDAALIVPQPSRQRLSRIHRFERLRRKLGWSFYELDRAIAAFQPGQINNELLIALSDMKRLRTAFSLPLEEMLAWWSRLDTTDYRPQGRDLAPSLYRRVFQNLVVFDADTLEIFKLDDAGNELAHGGSPLNDHLSALAAALGARTEELQMVVEEDATFDLGTLSDLYRVVSLARALRIPVGDLLTFRQLSAHDPFAAPSEAIRFRDDLAAVTGAGFTLPQIEYLLRHTESPGVPVAPSDVELAASLNQLRNALRDVRAQYVVVDDPEGTATATALGVLLEEAVVESAIELIRRGVLTPPGNPEAFLEEHLSFLDTATTLDALVGTDDGPTMLSPETQAAERFAFVLAPLVEHLRQTLGRSTILQTLASEFNLSAGTLVSILGDALGVFEEARFLEDEAEISPEEFPALFQVVRRLWKSANIVSTLRLTDSEVDFLTAHADELGILDLRSLPDSEPEAEALPDLFAAFLQLVELVSLPSALGGTGLFDLLREPGVFEDGVEPEVATEQFLDRLHQLTGWDLDSLTFLAGESGLALTFPEHYRNGHAVRRFRDCFDTLNRLGLTSPQVVPTWINTQLSAEAARAIRNAAKAKYDTTQWLQVARGINDPLRERLRDALVGHLLATRPEFHETEDLYGHFLIDPEMSACQLTSRVQQAISSVQLFVQRALLHLESGVAIPADAVAEWQWMKHYRVWEANRRVFLYPENWIEPELRDDKTPLFRDLEKALLQSDIPERALEHAITAYVTGLAEIARPEISAIYLDPQTHTHHLFARTRDLPHLYYHRRWERSRTWTPWERLPLDIEGEHLVPALIGRWFYLFWPVFQEKTDPPKGEDGHTHTYHELRLAWSLWQNGQWSAKRLSQAVLTLSGASALDRYLFRVVQRFSEPTSHGGFEGFGGGGAPRKIVVRLLTGPVISVELGRFQVEDNGSLSAESLIHAAGMSEPAPLGGLLSGMAVVETNELPLVLPSSETDFFGNAMESTLVHLPTLEETPGRFRIVYPHQYEGFATQSAFTYEDDRATFLVQPIQLSEAASSGGLSGGPELTLGIQHTQGITPDDVGRVFPLALARASSTLGLALTIEGEADVELRDTLAVSPFVSASGTPSKKFLFMSHYHAQADKFLSALFDEGLDGLLGRLELQKKGAADFFEDRYQPVPAHVAAPHPSNRVDFSNPGAYSVYNWELFFHVPLLVADRLRQDQRFEEAQRWYHYIFNPTECPDDNAPRCYWKVRPFFEYDLRDPESQPVQDMMVALSEGNRDLADQVAVWRDNPFNPHAIARLRTIAYQKTVVMKYLDNLIAWGDALFRQDTMETLNEATQLYILAARILGPRPEEIDTGEHPPVRTFSDLEASLDAFSNALVEIENHLAPNGYVSATSLTFGGGTTGSAPPPLGTTLFFCIPENAKLLGYWDTVEDRLFKIRHCMTLEGVVRQLPLFAPPIEPGLLVRAAAAGVDIASAVDDLNAPLAPYRFRFLLEKALTFNSTVKAFGNSLLDALNQRDGEKLARMRAAHEVELLKSVREAKQQQLAEAGEQLEALRRSRTNAEERQRHYAEIPDRIEEENDHLEELEVAGRAQDQALSRNLASADAARLIPDFAVGWSGEGPLASVSIGRANVLAFFQFRSEEASADAARASQASNLAGIRGAWSRRSDDWEFQAAQAAAEMRQIDKQIAAAEIREAIARHELETHGLQTAQAESVEVFMRDKFTNEELQNWRVSQLSSLFFQSYQLAYDLAQKAERAFRYELGSETSSFIEFGSWDNLRKGLLSGERLEVQLRRLENAHLEQNRREFELTKHVSLAVLNPLALLRLKVEGRCEIEVSEALFDQDYPGHYFRRIKSVSISIPAVTGPYTTVSCTLRLLRSSIRRQSTLLNGQYGRDLDNDDPRFSDSFGAIQSIAASSGHNDSGLFELNFRDERYLPFEGAGAISLWQLEMPNDFRQFDYDSISDVILHINYTAREGGGALRQAAQDHLLDGITALVTGDSAPGLHQPFSARHEFSTELHRFLHPPAESGQQSLALNLAQNRFPYMFKGRNIIVDQVQLFVRLADEFSDADASDTIFTLIHPGGEDVVDLDTASSFGNVRQVSINDINSGPGEWRLTVSSVGTGLAGESNRLNPNAIEDIILILHYRVG